MTDRSTTFDNYSTMATINIIGTGGSHLDSFLPVPGQSADRDYLGGAGHTAYILHRLSRPTKESHTYLFDYDLDTFAAKDANVESRYFARPVSRASFPQDFEVEATVDRIEQRPYGAEGRPFGSVPRLPVLQELKQRNGSEVFNFTTETGALQPAQHNIIVLTQYGDAYKWAREELKNTYYEAIRQTLLTNLPNAYYVWAPRLSESLATEGLALLGHSLTEIQKHRSIVVLTAAALRRLGFSFRGDKTLETNAEVFFDNLTPLNELWPLPKHVILMFENLGALYFHNDNQTQVHVKYCPFYNSPEEYYPKRFGTMRGYRTLMIACIVREISDSLTGGGDGFAKVHNGVQHGVVAGKLHYLEGLSEKGTKGLLSRNGAPQLALHTVPQTINDFLNTPSQVPDTTSREFKIGRKLAFASVAVNQISAKPSEVNNRIATLCDQLERADATLIHFAVGIVKYGLEAMAEVAPTRIADIVKDVKAQKDPPKKGVSADPICLPYATFGDIKTADRREIDGLRAMRALIERYVEDRASRERPLCIAVFGPPGSGKGFTIKQILKDVNVGKKETKALEINLSQLHDRAMS